MIVEFKKGFAECSRYNKGLMIESVAADGITFVEKSYLEYWDEELADIAITRPTSYVYAPNNKPGVIPQDDIALFAKALFIDKSIKLRICAAYQFRAYPTSDSSIRALPRYPYSDKYTPNPLSDVFSDIGGRASFIVEYLRRKDYIGALEQCVASCRSLDFGDIVVMGTFFDRVHKNRGVFVELPDGTVCNPMEAIKWLKEKRGGKEDGEID